ncbi:putative K domain-containing protein [Helianthus debilis subsp. tardiflorus]
MADEEVMGSVSPAPSDHKRKLDDFDSESFDQPPVVDGDIDAAAAAAGGGGTEDVDVKRQRIEEKSDGFEATGNGHQEEKADEPTDDITEPSDVIKNTVLEEDQEKADEPSDEAQKASVTDEPLDALNNESVTDETHEKAVDPESAENLEEAVKVEHQGSGVEQQDPATDVASQDDAFGFKEQSAFSDQSTSRRMEIPSNKVGVLIGKAGDTIRTLQHSSGARIQITRDAEADPNAATRPVQILGSIESINKAERLIKEVIAEADAGGSPSLVARGFSVHSSGIGEQYHMQVPNDKVGVIIGKGGETIKNLQTRSGARIQLIPQHLPEGDQSKERSVRITGDRKQIEMAREMIKEVMDQVCLRSSSFTLELPLIAISFIKF